MTTKCKYCNGHGADPMSDIVNWLTRPQCGGTGIEEEMSDDSFEQLKEDIRKAYRRLEELQALYRALTGRRYEYYG